MSRMCFNCMKITEDGEFCAFCGKKLKPVPAHHLLPGTVLNGKYIIGYALGDCGFGVTYIGLDNLLQIKVAIKEFFPKGIVGRNSTVTSNVSCLNFGESDMPLKKGQAFLLCSDGFWELINEKDMCGLLKKSETPQEWLSMMSEIVKKNGVGRNMDNFSAIAVWNY